MESLAFSVFPWLLLLAFCGWNLYNQSYIAELQNKLADARRHSQQCDTALIGLTQKLAQISATYRMHFQLGEIQDEFFTEIQCRDNFYGNGERRTEGTVDAVGLPAIGGSDT